MVPDYQRKTLRDKPAVVPFYNVTLTFRTRKSHDGKKLGKK